MDDLRKRLPHFSIEFVRRMMEFTHERAINTDGPEHAHWTALEEVYAAEIARRKVCPACGRY